MEVGIMLRTAIALLASITLIAFTACSSLLAESRFRDSIESNDIEYVRQNVSSIDVIKKFKEKPGYLSLAIKHDLPEIAEILIQNGADCNYTSEGVGQTPLQFAIFYDSPRVTEVLIRNGADVDGVTAGLSVPLVSASGQGRTEIVELLLTNGCDVGRTDSFERTALHWASSKGSVELVNLLLEYKVPVNAKDHKGKTPIDLAREAGKEEIVRILEKAISIQT